MLPPHAKPRELRNAQRREQAAQQLKAGKALERSGHGGSVGEAPDAAAASVRSPLQMRTVRQELREGIPVARRSQTDRALTTRRSVSPRKGANVRSPPAAPAAAAGSPPAPAKVPKTSSPRSPAPARTAKRTPRHADPATDAASEEQQSAFQSADASCSGIASPLLSRSVAGTASTASEGQAPWLVSCEGDERQQVLKAFFESWRGDRPPEELAPCITGVEAVVHTDASIKRFLQYQTTQSGRRDKPITTFHGMTCRDGTLARVAAAVCRDGLDPDRCRAAVHGIGAYVAAKGDKAFMYARNSKWHAGDGREIHSRALRILVIALYPGDIEKGELHHKHDCVTVDTGRSALRATQFCVPTEHRYRMIVTHLLTVPEPPLPPAALKRLAKEGHSIQRPPTPPPAAPQRQAGGGTPPPPAERLGSRASRLLLAATFVNHAEQQLEGSAPAAQAAAPVAAAADAESQAVRTQNWSQAFMSLTHMPVDSDDDDEPETASEQTPAPVESG